MHVQSAANWQTIDCVARLNDVMRAGIVCADAITTRRQPMRPFGRPTNRALLMLCVSAHRQMMVIRAHHASNPNKRRDYGNWILLTARVAHAVNR